MEFFSILPACAGVIPGATFAYKFYVDSSRMCGGDPRANYVVAGYLSFFPHVRG